MRGAWNVLQEGGDLVVMEKDHLGVRLQVGR